MGFWNNITRSISALGGPFSNGSASGTTPFYSIRDPRLAGLLSGLGSMNPRIISLQTNTDIACAWDKCPPIVSIICGKILADLNGLVVFKWAGTGEPVNLSSQLQARAMSKLMANPNPLQTWRQFRAQQKAYTQIFGFCPVLCIKPAGFTDPSSVKAMWNIPPQHITIKTTGKTYYQSDNKGIIESIETTVNGVTNKLKIEDVFILKDQYISLYQDIIPKSRLSALEMPVSNIIAAYKGANVMIEKRGAMGILSNRTKDAISHIPMQEGEKETLQQEWDRHGLSPELRQIIITESDVQWQQIAMPVKELMLYEAIEDGIRSCCSVYNYPYELFPKAKGDTFANREHGTKYLYTGAVIPESDSDMEVYNNYFQLGKAGIEMDMDFTGLDIFQVSESDKASALKVKAEGADLMFKSNAITLRRMREMLGEETTSDDDVYYFEWTANQQNQSNETAAATAGAGTDATTQTDANAGGN